ncbi:hypothetical protein SAMN05443575_3146 [Jatrophihabitans endophyticus]|uniref:Uncharacterized protein n=1 Tax=Jatrophihabitans endophyticus TaxID=1206085 RepID=A0A1M5PNV6_9ACTN|nr:hypothetical protein [Jatrophihabitans endophyticus]SHH03444.1 hypothetical protein SAMN05443575_3146 [Jatrophihabitans endophyticus]
MPEFTHESWARDLLTRMGYPVTTENMTSVLAWEYQEGGHFKNAATFNPLNSTLGHKTYGSMNGVGVATYPDYETGMTQTIKTLKLHYYDKIRADLQANADPATTTADIKASPWGTWHGGASTAGALGQARKNVAAHPVGTPTPATTPTPRTTPTSAAAPLVGAAAGAAGGGFRGADVDGLDRLAREFAQAAGVTDEVKQACEAIVAAAAMFGPFSAAFIAYLKGTVIPYLTRIAASLRAMSTLLSQHSQAQRDASASATSLPSYTPPSSTVTAGDTPATVTSVATATPVAPVTHAPAAVVGAVPLIGATAS